MATKQQYDKLVRRIKERYPDAKIKYKEDRRKEYEKRGLSFDKYVEMIIEEDNQGMADFKAEREIVKQLFPKPE